MNFRNQAVLLLATGFSVGRIPRAPGTFGALLGIPVSFVLAKIGFGAAVLVLIGFIGFAVWISGQAERLLGQKDASCIVIDEVVGVMVTLAGITMTPLNLVAGFIAFRVLDIAKPFPAGFLDAQAAGGWGIVMDDVVAGVYGNIFLRVLSSFFFQGAIAWTE